MNVNTVPFLSASLVLLCSLLLSFAVSAEEPPVVMVLGDSLSIGYGLEPGESWPERMAAMLAGQDCPVRLVNASVSGDTMADGLARLDWALAEEPDLCVVALGGNDGLRMLDTQRMAESLSAILAELSRRSIPALVAGMLPPPNFGAEYSERFGAVFARVAGEHGVPHAGFLLEGVAGEVEFNQPDGIHPNASGARLVARTMLPHVRALLPGCAP